MDSEYQVWKDIDERFKFCLLLVALCGCGWLAWHKFIYIVFLLIFGGIAAAMIPLYETSQERLSELKTLDEPSLQESIVTIREAIRVVDNFRSEYPKIEAIVSQFNIQLEDNFQAELEKAEVIYLKLKLEREEREYQQRQIERKREEWFSEQRAKKGVKYGAPPDSANRCPTGYPIRVTENLSDWDLRRGIYYSPGDPDYNSEAAWCFKCISDAESDGYGLSRKPYYVRKYGRRRYK